MKETRFIGQMQAKWQEFEVILKQPYKASDKLYEVFINIMDDLSFARTFYPNRSVSVYLNGLAQQIFVNIYKNRKISRSRLLSFWTDDLPRLMYESRKAFLISFLVFLGAFFIGALSAAMDDAFLEVILGESYVEMTKENIASGDPMAVYKQRGEFGMSLGITGNNLFVAFLTFIMGIFFSLGSIIILVSNGIMVGAFQFFFVKQELFWESFLTIWVHGTLEISAIIIGGAAGITMGSGLVFPGTYTRMKSFQRSARRGIKIMIGITPIIILAGFIEGYLTRHTEASYWLRGLFIFLCLAFVIGYFVWYPRWKAKRGYAISSQDFRFQPDEKRTVNWYGVKSVSSILGDTFFLLQQNFIRVLWVALVTSAVYTILVTLLSDNITDHFVFPSGAFATFSVLNQFFINDVMGMHIIVVLCLMGLTYLIFITISPIKQLSKFPFFKLSVPVAVFYSCIYFTGNYVFLVLIITFPILLPWLYHTHQNNGSPFMNLGQTLHYLSNSYGKAIGLFTILCALGILSFNILDTIIVNLFFEVVAWILPFNQETMDQVSVMILVFLTMVVLFLIISLFLIAFMVLHYVTVEIAEAVSLKQKIEQIGTTQKIRGLEKEG